MSYSEEVGEHLARVLREALSNGDLHLVVDVFNNDDLAKAIVENLGFTYHTRQRTKEL